MHALYSCVLLNIPLEKQPSITLWEANETKGSIAMDTLASDSGSRLQRRNMLNASNLTKSRGTDFGQHDQNGPHRKVAIVVS